MEFGSQSRANPMPRASPVRVGGGGVALRAPSRTINRSPVRDARASPSAKASGTKTPWQARKGLVGARRVGLADVDDEVASINACRPRIISDSDADAEVLRIMSRAESRAGPAERAALSPSYDRTESALA